MSKKLLLGFLIWIAVPLCAQTKLPVQWEELTAPDFVAAIEQAHATCVLPFGIIEKHGPHLPLGTDLINVRRATLDAAQQEYAIVFPEFYFGQIFEARHQPGTIAYSLSLQLQLLQETADEMARNGCRKVVIVNGHGGNEHLLPLFAQSQLASPKNYVVYVVTGEGDATGRPPMKSSFDAHAGEGETSNMMVSRPDLVHLDRAGSQSGADLNRLKDLPGGVYTAIWWYAKFPNHYGGDGSAGNLQLGEFDMKAWSNAIAAALRAIKTDQTTLELQKEFYEKTANPLKTKQ